MVILLISVLTLPASSVMGLLETFADALAETDPDGTDEVAVGVNVTVDGSLLPLTCRAQTRRASSVVAEEEATCDMLVPLNTDDDGEAVDVAIEVAKDFCYHSMVSDTKSI